MTNLLNNYFYRRIDTSNLLRRPPSSKYLHGILGQYDYAQEIHRRECRPERDFLVCGKISSKNLRQSSGKIAH